MIKILNIDHVVLRTTKLSEMLDFYCGVLGCVVERRLEESVGLVQLRAGTALIDIVPVDSELGRLGGQPPRQDGRNLDHFCLCIAPFHEQELLDYLASKGIQTGQFQRRYGAEGFSNSLYINDPEDNVVELKPSLKK